MSGPADAHAETPLSAVASEAPVRLARWLRLVPRDGIGARRRALAAIALTWGPIVGWALATGRLPAPAGHESVLAHFGVHVRCLLAIPALIAGESLLHAMIGRIARGLAASGVVPPERRAEYDALLLSLRRLRDSTLPWIGILAFALAPLFLAPLDRGADEVAWALDAQGGLGFGGWWFANVVRPLFVALLLAWTWRLALVTSFFFRLSRLGLSLVPSHPDHLGGIGIVQLLPGAFAPFSFALASAIGAAWAHRMLSHGAHVEDFAAPAALFVVLWSVLVLLPLLALSPLLVRTRRAGIAAYSALVGEHGRLTHRRWIGREDVGDPGILSAPELGPVADTVAMFDSVVAMQSIPIGKRTLILVLAPVLVPFLVVATIEIPLTDMLQQLAKALL